MTRVRSSYSEKGRQEIVRLNSFETLWSPLAEPVDYGRVAALSLFAEVLEDALPSMTAGCDVSTGGEHGGAGAGWTLLAAGCVFLIVDVAVDGVAAVARNLYRVWPVVGGSAAYFHALTEGLFCGNTSVRRIPSCRLRRSGMRTRYCGSR